MLYQVSVEGVWVPSAAHQIVNFLLEKTTDAMILNGDHISLEAAAEGQFVSSILRFETVDERDQVKTYLLGQKDLVVAGTSGAVEWHDCNHDESGACLNEDRIIWGSFNAE